MVNFYRSCRKLSDGLPLNEKEINVVRIYIHFTFSWHLFHGFFAGFILIFLGSLIYYFWNSLLFISIILYILSGVCIFYFIPIFPVIFRTYYNNCLKNFLIHHLRQFKKFNLLYTTYIPNSTFDIEKEKIYFLADGYYFYLAEDLLTEEELIVLGGKFLFKYPDIKTLNKNIVNFKLSDIVSFQCQAKTKTQVATLDSLIKHQEEDNLYCKIALKDFIVFNVGSQVADYLRNLVPEKEIY